VVEGRDKDMINRGGEKISAAEVENLLYQVPGIAEAAAVSVPDPDLGERVCAVIVPAAGEGPALEDIAAALTAMEVARYKIPERLLIVGELPLTKVGKIDKKALREIARDNLARRDAVEAG
jgi:non-ribosomal peptide synthetase component E (peptide arylation enzyme)